MNGLSEMSMQQIIMNFTIPPSFDDLQVIAGDVIDNIPEELLEHFEDIDIQIDDVVGEAIEMELNLDDPFDLLVMFTSGKEISPGVESKSTNETDMLTLYRRPILDLWCEEGEDLTVLIRQIIIEELGRAFDLSDDDVEEMVGRHHQGLL